MIDFHSMIAAIREQAAIINQRPELYRALVVQNMDFQNMPQGSRLELRDGTETLRRSETVGGLRRSTSLAKLRKLRHTRSILYDHTGCIYLVLPSKITADWQPKKK